MTPQPQWKRIEDEGGIFVEGIKRGMIFWATVSQKAAEGSEQWHDVPSPWVIVSNDAIHSKLRVVQAVPLTSKLHKGDGPFKKFRIEILESGIDKYTASGIRALDPGNQLALTEQLRVLSHARLQGGPIAALLPAALGSLDTGLIFVLDL